MSHEASVAVLEAAIDDAPLKAVLLGLANHAGPTGEHALPSIERLMVYTGLTRSTVRSRLKAATEAGLIRIVRQAYRYRPTEYAMDLDRLRSMKSPVIEALEGRRHRVPTYGGTEGAVSRPPEQLQEAVSPPSGGRVTALRGPSGGPETSRNLQEPVGAENRTPRAGGGRIALPPAIAVIRKVCHRVPGRALWPEIVKRVGLQTENVARWERVVSEWVGRGHNPTAYFKMLDVLEKGWSGPARGRPGAPSVAPAIREEEIVE